VAEERQVIASTPDYNSPFNFDLPAPSGKPEEQELAQISGLKAVVADLRGRGLSVAVAVGADINTITVGWNSFDLTYTLKLGSDPEDGDTRSAFHYFMLYPGIETGTPKNDLGCYDLAATDKLGCRLSLR